MATHAEEQPAAGWDDESVAPEDVPRGTSRADTSPPIRPPMPGFALYENLASGATQEMVSFFNE
ncbi:MAG: hypothetical protein F4181_06195 [Proteobacteria bacterium]|nr:hypothetical protein [Pseudomonadota bacterium]